MCVNRGAELPRLPAVIGLLSPLDNKLHLPDPAVLTLSASSCHCRETRAASRLASLSASGPPWTLVGQDMSTGV